VALVVGKLLAAPRNDPTGLAMTYRRFT